MRSELQGIVWDSSRLASMLKQAERCGQGREVIPALLQTGRSS